jgi:L-ascorbate metabolism protein UlaG (beta-lactamase superfamily)
LQLTWITHSCFRIENDGYVVLVDPGFTSPPDTLNDADAVLITHQHEDHYWAAGLAARVATRPHLPIYTNKSVAALADGLGAKIHVVGDGDSFQLAGMRIHVHGEWHAPIHKDVTRVRNVGFQFDNALFHAGDAWTDPHDRVDVVTVPEFGLFTKIPDAFDFIKQVRPRKMAIPCHDTGLDSAGLTGVDGFFAQVKTPPFAPGTGVRWFRPTKLQPYEL